MPFSRYLILLAVVIGCAGATIYLASWVAASGAVPIASIIATAFIVVILLLVKTRLWRSWDTSDD